MAWHDHIEMPEPPVQNVLTQNAHLNLLTRPGFDTANHRILVHAQAAEQGAYLSGPKIAYSATIPDAPRFQIHRGNLGVGRMHFGSAGGGTSPGEPHYHAYPMPRAGVLHPGVLGGDLAPHGVPSYYPIYSIYAQPRAGGGSLYFRASAAGQY